MRLTAAIACGIVALNCMQLATGETQSVLLPDALWMWWVFAASWAFSGFYVLLNGAE